MVQINYAITINPRTAERIVGRAGREYVARLSDTVLRDMPVLIKEEMRKEAPFRTGALRRAIIVTNKKKSASGKYDRRLNIVVASTSPYTGLVIRGAKAQKGNGSPGSGQFFGPATESERHLGGAGTRHFKATQGFKGGKPFRARFGQWPGYPGNDFITRALPKAREVVATHYRFEAIRLLSITHRRFIS